MKKILAYFFLLPLLFGCKKNLESPSWDVDGYVPLFHSSVTLQKALGDTLVSVNAENKLQLVYNQNILSLKIDSLFNLPDTTTQEVYTIPVGGFKLPPSSTIVEDTIDTDIKANNLKLRHALIKSGQIVFKVSSSVEEDISIELNIPGASKNGIPFSSLRTVQSGTPQSPSTLIDSFDLTGYKLDLTGNNQNTSNSLAIVYKALVHPNADTADISAGDYVSLETTFSNIVPDYAEGNFGTQHHNLQDGNVSFDLFKYFQAGMLNLKQASLTFSIQNQVGTDVQCRIKELSAINLNSGLARTLQGNQINTPINLNRARKDSSLLPPVQTKSYTFSLNETNSNITDFVSVLPSQLGYNFEIDINPVQDISAGYDFIYYNTGISIDLNAEIPLNFSASGVQLRDTSAFTVDNSSREDAQNINSGRLIFYANNAYPLDLNIQFYLADSNFVILDSLFDSAQPISPALTQNQTRIPSRSELIAPLSKQKIDHLYKTELLITKASFNTANLPDTVSLLGTDFLDLRGVGDFNYTLDLK